MAGGAKLGQLATWTDVAALDAALTAESEAAAKVRALGAGASTTRPSDPDGEDRHTRLETRARP